MRLIPISRGFSIDYRRRRHVKKEIVLATRSLVFKTKRTIQKILFEAAEKLTNDTTTFI